MRGIRLLRTGSGGVPSIVSANVAGTIEPVAQIGESGQHHDTQDVAPQLRAPDRLALPCQEQTDQGGGGCNRMNPPQYRIAGTARNQQSRHGGENKVEWCRDGDELERFPGSYIPVLDRSTISISRNARSAVVWIVLLSLCAAPAPMRR